MLGKVLMLIGYVRVSKSDGLQVLDLQKDALRKSDVAEERIYEALASGRTELTACLKNLPQ